MTQTTYYIGVDGGGTKCKATLFDAHLKPMTEGVAGPANITRELENAQSAIVSSIQLAVQKAGLTFNDILPNAAVCAGLAGANIQSAAHALSNWQHPFKSFNFTSDLHTAAIGAHAGKNGAVLIVGTGSCAAALKGQKLTQFGGYGFLLGDKGSGAWLGKQAIVKALESIDGVQPHSSLTEQIMDSYECQSAVQLVETFNKLKPSLFAQLAPMVIEAAKQNDPLAVEIVTEAASYLNTIADKSLQISGGELALVGGVANAIKPWFSQQVQDVCISPQQSPEWGALFYHQQILKGATHGQC